MATHTSLAFYTTRPHTTRTIYTHMILILHTCLSRPHLGGAALYLCLPHSPLCHTHTYSPWEDLHLSLSLPPPHSPACTLLGPHISGCLILSTSHTHRRSLCTHYIYCHSRSLHTVRRSRLLHTHTTHLHVPIDSWYTAFLHGPAFAHTSLPLLPR